METPDTLPDLIALLPRTVDGLINFDGQAFYTWQSEKLNSGGYSRPGSDLRERYDRMDACAPGQPDH